ncbi:MarR family winged helix-turn-helix transcriptional regulator [Mesorhizobium qingshengii]|uniref:DNA-binding transcriptional regulator, MarR family n=1 Tax=Mesorhizobium qingshengii TaxID=1165689 RepID=A0A1G5W4Q8_9HYPH|nr:MarR family transcriptional regulator [Mesorhizobium qingshengii]SDA53128.1 DNA-binding transcriptional regulator, MarR family [Mesorhizobium qingshengii]
MTTRTTLSPLDVPADFAGIPKLAQHLCFALYSASGLMTKLYRPLLEPLGLTYPQYLAMLALWEHAPRTVGEVGETLGLDSATLTPLLKRLEANGMVTRRRDPADERRVLVEPTPQGQALRESAKAVSAAMRCHSPLDDDELKSLHHTLTRLIDGLREATASAPDHD